MVTGRKVMEPSRPREGRGLRGWSKGAASKVRKVEITPKVERKALAVIERKEAKVT